MTNFSTITNHDFANAENDVFPAYIKQRRQLKILKLGYNMDCEPLNNWDYLTLTNFLTITNHNFAYPEK